MKFSREEKILLALMAGLQFTHIVDFIILMPLGAQLMRLFNITPSQFGLLVSAYTFAAAISSLIGVVFLDRFDRKKALIFLGIGFVFGTLACGWAPGYRWLLVARAVAGFFGGMLGSCVLSIVSDAIPFERRGSAMGVVMGSFSVASVVGVPFALYLANTFSWHMPFLFLGGLSAVVLVVIFFFMPSMVGHLEKKRHPWWEPFHRVFNSVRQQQALTFMFFLVLGQFSIIPLISPSLVANAGLREDQLPLIYIFGGVASFFTSPIIGRLSDAYGKVFVFRVAGFVSLVPIVWVTNLGASSLTWILSGVVLFFMTMTGRVVPAMALVSEATDPQHRGSFMSFIGSIQQVSSGLASLLAGAIVAKGSQGQLLNYPGVGAAAIIFSLLALYLAGVFARAQS